MSMLSQARCTCFEAKSGNKIKCAVEQAPPEGMSFLYKRLNDAKFVWPQMHDGKVCLSTAQLSMLLDNGARSIIELMGAIPNGDSRGLQAQSLWSDQSSSVS